MIEGEYLRAYILDNQNTEINKQLLSWLYEKSNIEEISLIKEEGFLLNLSKRESPDIVFIRLNVFCKNFLQKVLAKNTYALSWDDENYYLITFSTKYNGFTHYRVDRMTDIDLIDEERDPLPDREHFDIAEYTKKVFNMFGGEEVLVQLQFDNSLVNAVIDRFGKDVVIGKKDENSFCIWIKVAVSSTFFAWISQFGSKVKILSPEPVIKQYIMSLNEIVAQYEQGDK